MMELRMDECLLRGDSASLASLLYREGLSASLVTRLDRQVTKELGQAGFSRVCVLMKAVGTVSQNPEDLELLLRHGLGAKVVLWFEDVRDLLTSDLHRNSTPVLSLTEQFYEYFLLLGQASGQVPVSLLSVVLLQFAQLALEPAIKFGLRLEAIRNYNIILESLSREQRRQIQTDTNHCQILDQLAAAVLTVGDYELQVSLSEALCRLTPRKDREQRANHWFSSCDISSAFCNIQDGDFEVDCRRFLNFVNCYHGDQRRVYTFPCLRAFLDSSELFCPKDEKLDEFWIDFNLDSECVSFFIDDPQGFLWQSIHLLKQEVHHYSLQYKQNGFSEETILSVHLLNPIMHNNTKGQTVEMFFSSKHHSHLEEAAGKVLNASGLMKLMSSARVTDEEDLIWTSPFSVSTSARRRSYFRKKPKSQSRLKILPLSSPSSGEDHSITKTPERNRAAFVSDRIRSSTPDHTDMDSGIIVEMALDSTQEQEVVSGVNSFSLEEAVFSTNRKREAPNPEPAEGEPLQKRKPESEPGGRRSNVAPKGASTPQTPTGRSITAGEPPAGWAESEEELSSGIMVAFKTFKTKLQEHSTKVEAEVLQSLSECQQHITSLLTAVQHHRLLLLQRFERKVVSQLNQLVESSTSLSTIESQSFFQSQVQSFGIFCDKQQLRLKSLGDGDMKDEEEKDEHFRLRCDDQQNI